MIDRIDTALGRLVSMRALAVLRIWMGPVVLLYLRPFLDDAVDGRSYRDMFHEPYASWYPDLPRGWYVAILWLTAAAALAMMAGLATKVSAVVVLVGVVYNQFLSTTHAHHNRAYLMIVLTALAVVPCGRELSADRWLRRRRGRPPLPTVAPAWSDRLHQPSASGGAAAVVITRGAIDSSRGAKRRKSAGTKSTAPPASCIMRSMGPKNPDTNRTLGRPNSS